MLEFSLKPVLSQSTISPNYAGRSMNSLLVGVRAGEQRCSLVLRTAAFRSLLAGGPLGPHLFLLSCTPPHQPSGGTIEPYARQVPGQRTSVSTIGNYTR